MAQTKAFADATNVEEEVRLLREQNALLQSQVQKQDKALDTLSTKMKKLEDQEAARAIAAGENPPPEKTGYDIGNVHISAEGGAAFFNTGTEGFAPPFRVPGG